MSVFSPLKSSRSTFSYILHFSFNCILSIASISITAITGNPILGLFFVLLSKWRIFAVHPYHWLANISANAVDLIVGSSFILLSLPASGATPDVLPVHIILILSYIVWLTLVKPGTSTSFAEMQSLSAIFLGTNVATILFSSSSALLVAIISLITFFAFRHLLLISDEEKIQFSSTVFALFFAWIALILRFWLIVYGFEKSGIVVSQISIVITLIAFAVFRVYLSALRHDGRPELKDIFTPILFSVIIVMVILLIFSSPIFNI